MKLSTHLPRCDPSREAGSMAVLLGRRDAAGSYPPRPAGIPISFPASLWPWHQPQNLLLLMQTLPLPRRYQGSASPPAARHKQLQVPRGPHPPQADITLRGELTTPGAAGFGRGWLWLPWAPASRPGPQRQVLPCCFCILGAAAPWLGGLQGSPAHGQAPQWLVEPCTSS